MEILLIIIIIFSGMLFGTFTGLIPGVHINLVSLVLLINYTYISQFFHLNYFIIFIISMGITHTFVDFIPSVLFGVPSSDNTLSVLPAHRLTQKGESYYAIFVSNIGSFLGMIFAFLICPILFYSLDYLYESIKEYIPYILLTTLCLLVLSEKGINKKIWSVIIILFSASLGVLTLNSKILNSALLVLFTGCFGVASLITSINDNINTFPKQQFKLNKKIKPEYIKASFIGTITSAVCAISPGVGNAQAATISTLFFKNIGSEVFIVVVSAINTVNFILSFVTFYLIGRARNGSVYIISQVVENIEFNALLIYFFIIFLVSIIAFFLNLRLGKFIIKKIEKINFKIFNYSIIMFLGSLIFFFEGTFGILVLIASTSLGLLCTNVGVRRVHLMGVLLVPVIMSLI